MPRGPSANVRRNCWSTEAAVFRRVSRRLGADPMAGDPMRNQKLNTVTPSMTSRYVDLDRADSERPTVPAYRIRVSAGVRRGMGPGSRRGMELSQREIRSLSRSGITAVRRAAGMFVGAGARRSERTSERAHVGAGARRSGCASERAHVGAVARRNWRAPERGAAAQRRSTSPGWRPSLKPSISASSGSGSQSSFSARTFSAAASMASLTSASTCSRRSRSIPVRTRYSS